MEHRSPFRRRHGGNRDDTTRQRGEPKMKKRKKKKKNKETKDTRSPIYSDARFHVNRDIRRRRAFIFILLLTIPKRCFAFFSCSKSSTLLSLIKYVRASFSLRKILYKFNSFIWSDRYFFNEFPSVSFRKILVHVWELRRSLLVARIYCTLTDVLFKTVCRSWKCLNIVRRGKSVSC